MAYDQAAYEAEKMRQDAYEFMRNRIDAEQIKVEPVQEGTLAPHPSMERNPGAAYVAIIDDAEIGTLIINRDDVPIQVFSYLAKDGFFAESMIEAMQGLASLHNGAL